MSAATLRALADRCEREEPSRELDVEIALRVGWRRNRNLPNIWMEATSSKLFGHPPRYTTSLDAAATLVPEGWCISSLSSTCGPHWRCTLFQCGHAHTVSAEQPIWSPRIKSGPLALCAAALRARATVAEVAGPPSDAVASTSTLSDSDHYRLLKGGAL